MTDRPRLLHFDLPELRIGVAEYREGPTGCTLLHFPAGASCAVDVRGGAVAARELASVGLLDGWGEVDAVLFAGGSTWGLDAAGGVMHALLEERGGSVEYDDIPAVPAAAVYDFSGRGNAVYPDGELGVAAFKQARGGRVPVGRVGAGAHVTVGSYFGERYAERAGQGAAFAAFGALKVFALVVVNASGNVLDRQGKILAGGRDPTSGTRRRVYEQLVDALAQEGGGRTPPPAGNTVLTAVVTNAALDRLALRRVAVMVHAALARVIDPLHTPEDGDVVFALSTARQRLPGDLVVSDVGVLAGHLAQEAVFDSLRR